MVCSSRCINLKISPKRRPTSSRIWFIIPRESESGIFLAGRFPSSDIGCPKQRKTKMNQSQRSLSSATTEEGNETKNVPGDGVQRSRTASVERGSNVLYSENAPSTTGSHYHSSRSKIADYFLVELNPRRADIILIVCGFVGGLVDGLSFNAWGSFSSMQTGMYSKAPFHSTHM